MHVIQFLVTPEVSYKILFRGVCVLTWVEEFPIKPNKILIFPYIAEVSGRVNCPRVGDVSYSVTEFFFFYDPG